MATTVRNIELMLSGSFGKEQLSNDGMQNLALGISGAATIVLTSSDHTLTTDNQGESMRFVLIFTGALTANVNVIVPAESRVYVADNRTTGAFTVTVKTAAGGGVAVDQGARTLVYCDGTTVYPVASGTGGGGGSGAPTDAAYLVQSAHALLTGERVVTNTPTVVWDFATPGAAGAIIPDGGVSYAKIQDVASTRLLGRFTAGPGDVQEITPGTGLTLDAGGVLSATAVGQPLDATLTALAGVATGANQVPYFTGTDTAAQTPLTPFARTLLDDADQTAMRTTLGLTPGTDVQPLDATLTALAGVTTGANTLPFFTGTDTASTTVLTAFMRSLLDDADQATAQATLGITGGGSGGTPIGATVQRAATFAVPAALTTAIPFDTEVVDEAAFWSSGQSTRLTFATAGWYSVSASVNWDTVSTSRFVFIRLNGMSTFLAEQSNSNLTDLRQNISTVYKFAAGDYVEILVFVGTACSLDYANCSVATITAGTVAGATTFLALTDTPDAYAANALKILRVNAAATATEFGPVLGTMAEQNANAVAITGGSATGITSLIVASGGVAQVVGETYLDGIVNARNTALGASALYALKVSPGAIYTEGLAVGTHAGALGNGSIVADGVVQFTGSSFLDGPINLRNTVTVGNYASVFGGTVQVAGQTSLNSLVVGGGGLVGQMTLRHDKTTMQGFVIQGTGDDAGGTAAIFFASVAGSNVGSIIATATSTTYNTASDSRLKHAITPLTAALDRIRALRPVSFKWRSDDSPGVGFIAHEVQEVVDGVITGEADAVNEDGDIVPQQIDHSKLVPWLTSAVQALLARVETLEAHVAARSA